MVKRKHSLTKPEKNRSEIMISQFYSNYVYFVKCPKVIKLDSFISCYSVFQEDGAEQENNFFSLFIVN